MEVNIRSNNYADNYAQMTKDRLSLCLVLVKNLKLVASPVIQNTMLIRSRALCSQWST